MTFSHKRQKIVYRVFISRFLGNFLIYLSVFFIAKTFIGPLSSESKYFIDNNILKKTYTLEVSIDETALDEKKDSSAISQQVATSEQSQLAKFFGGNTKTIISPIDSSYSIVIPKIAANAKIIRNVDPSDEEEYLESLKYGVAHALGTSFPGEGGNVFLFAHSTDYIWNVSAYNAVFYLLYKLEVGDEINVFYEGKRYIYLVSDKKIVSPDDVEHLVNTTPNEQLTLQTCWPPGTTFQRLLVFAKRKAI